MKCGHENRLAEMFVSFSRAIRSTVLVEGERIEPCVMNKSGTEAEFSEVEKELEVFENGIHQHLTFRARHDSQ